MFGVAEYIVKWFKKNKYLLTTTVRLVQILIVTRTTAFTLLLETPTAPQYIPVLPCIEIR